MNFWLYFILFFVIVFSYIHVQQQWKIGEDLEVFEHDYHSLKAIQNTCQLKQPIIFHLDIPLIDTQNLEFLNVKDSREYNRGTTFVDNMILPYKTAHGLLSTDTKSIFYSDRNDMNESWTKWFQLFDSYVKPPLTLYSEKDIIYGSYKSHTVTKLYLESHTFIFLPPESNYTNIRIKMTPYKNKVFLDYIEDYTYYEFWSSTSLFSKNLDTRVKCLDFLLKPGHVLFIPSYWFYSIEFQDKRNEVCVLKYTTTANFMANIKHISLFYLQQQNINEKLLKPFQNSDCDDSDDHCDSNNEIDQINDIFQDLSSNVLNDGDTPKTTAEVLIDELKSKNI